MSSKGKQPSDTRVVATSLSVSVSDVICSLAVAMLSGSTVMLSQALQSFSDVVAGSVLFLGVKRSRRAADMRYQFGYGRELFFWVLMSGIFMFMGTGALSFYFGYQQLHQPEAIRNLPLALGMLGLGFGTNLYALTLSIRRLRHTAPDVRWLRHVLRSSIVEAKATLLVDFMGVTAAALGMVALITYHFTGNAAFDGLGSMVIGVAMMVASLLLIKDVRDLIVGRSVDDEVAKLIIQATTSVEGIRSVLDLRTMYLGSSKLLVLIEVHVQDDLTTDQIEQVVDTVKAVVIQNVPQAHHIQVEIETPDDELATRAHPKPRRRHLPGKQA